jgi:hypothetical protein
VSSRRFLESTVEESRVLLALTVIIGKGMEGSGGEGKV